MPHDQDSQPNHHSDDLFNTALSPELMRMQGEQPRIAFTGVTARAFALKASMNQLQLFCDNYLNFVDEPGRCTGHYFKAALPFVYLQMINYGKMSTESTNLGWIAQHEVLFSVPVEWYVVNPETGVLDFHDWALVCPFVYVDNDQSLQTGREVFGWSKVRSWLQPIASTWTTDPRLPRQLLNLRTEIFPRLYEGESQQARTLIEIVQDAPPSLFRNPVGRNDAFSPLWALPQAMRQSYALMMNMFEVTTGLPIFGYQRSRNTPATGQMLRKMLDSYKGMVPWMSRHADTMEIAHERSRRNRHSPYINNLTFKQFRDAEEPELACYQALVNSKIAVEHYRDGGLLGGPSVMTGDLTGGYRIKIHDYPEQPIVSTLGLEVSATERDEFGQKTRVLTPILPFWTSCDLRYDLGRTLCWRTRNSHWVREGGAADTDHADDAKPKTTPRNRYNTTLGAAIQESIGPFHYPDTTLRVYPLMADPTQLKKFVHEHLNPTDKPEEDTGTRGGLDEEPELAQMITYSEAAKQKEGNCIDPWGSYVYMVVTSYDSQHGKPYSEQNNIGSIAGREVAFWVPVKWKIKGELVTVGFITAYVFCDNMRRVITEREVAGRPVEHATIKSDDNVWLRESGPVADRRSLAKVRTLLMRALNAGQPAQMSDLIEIYEGDVERYNEDIPWAIIKSDWAPHLERDRQNKVDEKRRWPKTPTADNPMHWDQIQKKFAAVLKESLPINFYNLKQYRATENARSFCFQSMVHVPKTINALWDLRELPQRTHIAINEYPSMPIVKQLGLRVKTTDSRAGGVVAQLQPVRPFFARVSMTEKLGRNLYTRLPGESWKLEPSAEQIKNLGKDTHWVDRMEEPQAVVESLLWSGFGGHDTRSAWKDRDAVDRTLGKNSEMCPPGRKDREFFIPRNSFCEPVNNQVEAANTPDKPTKSKPPDAR